MLIYGGKSIRKKPKVEIRDALGNKISLKKLKAAYKEETLNSTISKKMDTGSRKETDIFNAVVAEVEKQFKLDIRSLHGISHWSRVMKVGLYLAEKTKADSRVIVLFAALHDSCRENEGADPEHGSRAIEYLLGLYNKGLLPIDSAKQLSQLMYACEHHNKRDAESNDITIQTCWDADRLDLYRVGAVPDPTFLYTEAGKSPEVIDFASQLYLKSRISSMVRIDL